MKFTSDVVVLSARRYSMTDDKTGELVQGTKIEYVEDWDPQPQHFSLKSAPTRKISHSLLPQGCFFLSCTISPT